MAFKRRKFSAELRTPLISAATMIFNQLSTAVFGVVLAAYLKADIYGTVNLSRSIFAITLVLSPLGLDLALQRHIGRSAVPLPTIAAEVFWTRTVAFALSTVVFIGMASGGASLLQATVFPHPNFAHVMIVMMASLPFATDMAVIGGAQRGLSKPATALIASNFVQPAARIIAICSLLAVVSGIWASVYGTLISYIVAWMFLGYSTYRALPLNGAPLRDSLRAALDIFRYSTTLGLGTLVFTIARSLDTIFLGSFGAIADVGRYGIALMIGQLVSTIGASLGQTIGARFSAAGEAGDKVRLVQILAQNIRLTSILCAPLCVAIALWGSDIYLLLGPTYRTPALVFVLVAMSQFVQTVTQNSGWPLVAAGRQNLELLNNVLALVVQIIACAVTVPVFGIVGAAASTFLTIFSMAVFRQVQLARVFGERIVGLAAIVPLSLSSAVAVPVYLVYRQIQFHAWWLTGIFVITFTVASFATLAIVYGKGEFSRMRRGSPDPVT